VVQNPIAKADHGHNRGGHDGGGDKSGEIYERDEGADCGDRHRRQDSNGPPLVGGAVGRRAEINPCMGAAWLEPLGWGTAISGLKPRVTALVRPDGEALCFELGRRQTKLLSRQGSDRRILTPSSGQEKQIPQFNPSRIDREQIASWRVPALPGDLGGVEGLQLVDHLLQPGADIRRHLLRIKDLQRLFEERMRIVQVLATTFTPRN
jgi:hypothetical protein